MEIKTTDDKTYYNRETPIKMKFIEDFVKQKDDINIVYDIGCNNGDISYNLQKNYDKKVFGIDLSDELNPPSDYNFRRIDIVNDNGILMNDCTLFLSLYHHILGNNGIDVADDLFYKLLLRTKYLIFDCGNLSEKDRSDTYWYKKQEEYFKDEKELLDHFHIKYDIIGIWHAGGGKRTVVVFYSDDFDDKCEVINSYKRKIGTHYQQEGLFDVNKCYEDQEFFEKTIFKKLNNKTFFSKKHLTDDYHKDELENIIEIYNIINPIKLIKFYGVSKEYGYIYEWLNNFKNIDTMCKYHNDLKADNVL